MTVEELTFIRQLITTCTSINTVHITRENKVCLFNENEYANFVYSLGDSHQNFEEYQMLCSDGMLVHLITQTHIHFCILCISKQQEEHLVVGPFLDHTLSDAAFYEVIELLHLTIEHAAKLKLFYQSLQVCDVTQIIDIFQLIRERISNPPCSSPVITLDNRVFSRTSHSPAVPIEEIEKEIIYKTMEERYLLEEQMLHAISIGDVAKAQEYLNAFSSVAKSLERTKDFIRNKKNLLTIGNTLYRKAAQAGGVHPVYLDEISTKWAIRIENASSLEALDAMMPQMVRAYCILVKNHSLAQYSPIVKKAITYIKLNIASPLTVTEVAHEVGVSPDYLTRLFKKELDTPVISFINQKRIQASLQLLNTSDLCIQDIGDMVGITDTSYFNKLFKKYIGISPKQYRESLK